MRFAIVILLSTFFLRCSDSGTGSPATIGGEEIVLAYGEQYAVPGEALLITFQDVADSRCPSDANCIWAGNGQAVLSLVIGRTEIVRSLNTFEGPRTTRFSSFEIELKALNPYPRTDIVMKKEDYIVTLVLRRE